MQAFRQFSGLALLVACLTAWPTDSVEAWQDETTVEVPDDGALVGGKTEVAEQGPLREGSFLAWMIHASGIFGFLILLLAFILMVLITTQLSELRRDNYLPQGFLDHFERQLNDKNYQGAYEAAKGNDSFIAKILAAGMARLPRGYDDAVQGMQEVGDEEALSTEHSIGYLSLIGSVAPMLGFLGTVQGMLLSFYAIAVSTSSPRTSELADGVATALVTTLEGLLVAIPAMVCFVLFRNRLAKFTLECGNIAEEMMRRFQGMKGQIPAPRSWGGAAPVTAPALSQE